MTTIAIATPIISMPVAVAMKVGLSGDHKYGTVSGTDSLTSRISGNTVAEYLALPPVQTAIVDWLPVAPPLVTMAKILAWKALLPCSPEQRQLQVQAWFPNKYHSSLTGIEQLVVSMNGVVGQQQSMLPPFSSCHTGSMLKLSVLLEVAQHWEDSGNPVQDLSQAVQDLEVGKPATFVAPRQKRWCCFC